MVGRQREGTSEGRRGYGAAVFLLLFSMMMTMTMTMTIMVEAFAVVPQQPTQPQSALAMNTAGIQISDEQRVATIAGGPVHVKKAGGGVPMVQAGDRSSFWDPCEEGKLGMDGDWSLEDRLHQGTEFCLQQQQDLLEEEELDIFNDSTTASSSVSSTYLPATTTTVPSMLHAAQCWLEHLDSDEVPNYVPPTFAKANKPVQATVLGRTKIIEDTAPGDIEHVVLRLPTGFHYVEGQSLSVIPPGLDPKTNKKYKPRLYSIASTRYGDLLDGTTVSLCVRRAEYTDPNTGLIDATKQGVCSNYLCDAVPGMVVDVAGPVGKTMVLPRDPSQDIIMVATGTGIAPFRAFLHRLFMEQTIAKQMFTGTAWLILGVPTTSSLLYHEEFEAMVYQNKFCRGQEGKLKIQYAISREMHNQENGGKLYVQDVLKENATELFARLEDGAVIYFCGLKGMMPGILDALAEVCHARGGMDWSSTLKKYKDNHQWHVEVY